MERKIGSVFKIGNEWYQCLEYRHSLYKPGDIENTIRDIPCFSCCFSGNKKLCGNNALVGECHQLRRSDGREVYFKKLKKFGEPYEHNGKTYQLYQSPIPVDTTSSNLIYKTVRYDIIEVEIKQNQENMEEKKLNLKPFDLEAARNGKPVCTRDGCKARIICFDAANPLYPLIVLIDNEGIETPFQYTKDGLKSHGVSGQVSDLMMLSEKHEGWMNLYKENIYGTKEEALIHKAPGTKYIDTIKVKWQE